MKSEKRPVRIGMMSFAHMHAASYADCVNRLPGAELAGIADDDSTRALEMADRFGTRCFKSYDELLAQDIDGVIVCPENIHHKALTVMAAQAGKHVMCEKPLAISMADGNAMIAACKDNGVKLQTAFPCRFSPEMAAARRAIQAGRIGKIIAINGTNHGKCPCGWFTDLSISGGGAVIDHTVHVVDLMRWTMESEVTEVYAEISNLMLHKNFDDTGILSMAFDNGVFATLDSSWSRPPSFPTWGDVTMTVVGTEGTIRLDLFAQAINRYSDSTMSASWEYFGGNVDLGLVRSFIESIAQDLPAPITGEDGLAAAAVALAAYESAVKGSPVKLAEIYGRA